MGVRDRLIFLGAGCLAVLSACKRNAPPVPVDAAAPVDHLAPGEIVEGKDRAFGLPLPRDSKVEARFAGSVHVTSILAPESLANFVRARVKDGVITAGGAATKLENVVAVADPARVLTIEVRPTQGHPIAKSEMIVRDTTPPPFDPNLSEEERWRRAGLTPSGELLDPKHLE
jgi:hypothetical protein